MSKKFKYLKRDGTGDVIKSDEFVGTKSEENIVRADDLERIKEFMNGKVDSYLNEGADITENDTDWTNETELKALLTSGEMVNIKSLGLGSAAGIVGTLDVDGKITMVGLHLSPNPTGDDIGVIEITFDAAGKITGINMFTRYAKFDLSNVNVGVANAGKTVEVKADGTLEYVTSHSGGVATSNIQIFDGQVLSFSKQKTTGAFADRTLFSELAIPKGYAILGGTGGIETKGSIPKLTATNRIGAIDGQSTNLGTGDTDTELRQVGTTRLPQGQKNTTTINTAGTFNNTDIVYAGGIEIVAYVYTALKDITFADMGK